jgi:hypothetical protein
VLLPWDVSNGEPFVRTETRNEELPLKTSLTMAVLPMQIRGATTHYEAVVNGATSGILSSSAATGRVLSTHRALQQNIAALQNVDRISIRP